MASSDWLLADSLFTSIRANEGQDCLVDSECSHLLGYRNTLFSPSRCSSLGCREPIFVLRNQEERVSTGGFHIRSGLVDVDICLRVLVSPRGCIGLVILKYPLVAEQLLPTRGVSADRDPRERGSRPLNTHR